MTPDQLFSLVANFRIEILVKFFFLVIFFFYLVFSMVVYRQISLMTQVLETGISPVVKMVALIQILAVAVLLLLGVMLL